MYVVPNMSRGSVSCLQPVLLNAAVSTKQLPSHHAVKFTLHCEIFTALWVGSSFSTQINEPLQGFHKIWQEKAAEHSLGSFLKCKYFRSKRKKIRVYYYRHKGWLINYDTCLGVGGTVGQFDGVSSKNK